ncbi:MFS transporter [Thiotrichales bacterium 19S9-12]|nr:MFS transporter [Thiotrichales bacterium 19S9-11]MCF6811785.1 MFS transporter [Thiotrichales bacterium 19S9-12]
MAKILKTRRFLPLFVVQFLEALNDNLIKYAFIILITYTLNYLPSTINSLSAVAGGIFILPYFLLSAFSGQLADKYDKTTIIRWVKVFEILAMCVGAIGFYFQSVHILLFTILLLGIHSTLFGPIKYSILPQHLNKGELLTGNAYVQGGTFIAILLGTMLGNKLFPLPYGPEIVTSLGLALAIIGLITSFAIPKAPGNPKIKINFNIFLSTWQNIQNTKTKPQIFNAILGISWFWLVAACYMTVFPAFVKYILGGTPEVFNFFIILFSVGIAFGAFVIKKIQKDEITIRYVPIASFCMTLFMLLFYFATHLYENLNPNIMTDSINLATFLSSPLGLIIALITFLISISGSAYTVPLYAMVQHLSDPSERAQMIATNNIMNSLFIVLMSVMLAVWMQVFQLPTKYVFLALAVLNLLLSFYVRKIR